ncbi:GAF domain-containing protein [Sinomonas sp. JGH33]|uniref:GAF domain-containing protein n=1 Tax=Sinomonas terricola TaxID=3110330 RepID=A0ABU5T0P5_9MICC|nr:GAF domain-containing protein [Sinomonas sp. JGH33]MEA5453220.1 GAF domain-containing protein [Sinomonas sp. JGH33]
MDAQGEGGGGSVFPEAAAGRIEDLLRQFVSRAHELLDTQERMRGLVSAVVPLAEDLDLAVVLHRVVNAARDLVRAEYGALGVLAPDGTALSHFITAGIPDELIRAIGPLPTGHGVLGLLIREPHPLRLHDLGTHPESHGFPAHHPRMSSFLGVPIRVGDEVFGNLYLTEKRGGGDFTAEDEDLVVALAAAAGVAIQNARLFDDTARRERWLESSMEVAGTLLDAEDLDEAVGGVAAEALRVSDSAMSAILKPWGTGRELSWGARAGEGWATLDSAALASAAGRAAQVASSGKVAVVPAAELFGDGPAVRFLREALLVPFGHGTQDQGALLLARGAGAAAFPAVDVEIAPVFCGYASLALQVARSHRLREELLVVTDRDRIARDLHDVVIQRLFAAGLSLQGLRRFIPPGSAEDKVDQITAELDDTIFSLRSTIYSLNEARARDSLSVRLVRAVQDGAVSLRRAPRVELSGPIDTAVPADVADQALAVLSEGVSNAVRHADADTLWVSAGVADGEFELVVVDDGKGLGEVSRRSGLKNVEERAAELGGEFEVGPADDGGTRFRWAVPLPSG